MELTIETFPTEAMMLGRKAELEANGFTIAFAGKAGPSTDVLIRIWAADKTTKTSVFDLAQSWILVVEP